MVRKRITEVERRIMKEIAVNLKRILLHKSISQKQLSELTGISTSAISDYMNEKTLMAPSIIQLIAESLDVKTRDISGTAEKDNEAPGDTALLPIVGKISCGSGNVAYEDIEGYEPTPLDWIRGGEYMYLRAKGDSMVNARILDGDLLLIRKQDEVEDGEIAAVLIDDETVLKKVYRSGNQLILQSENPKYKPMVCHIGEGQQIKIIGKLKKIVINT